MSNSFHRSMQVVGFALLLFSGQFTAAQTGDGLTVSGTAFISTPVTTATGGDYSVTGVAGMPITGTASGEGLELNSGFWLGPIEVLFRLNLAAQWNLVSIPILPWDARLSALLAGIEGGPVAGYFWGWDGDKYVAVDRLEPGKAYWVFSRAAATIPVLGRQPDSSKLHLPAGWNLVGPQTAPPFAALPLPLVTQPANASAQTIWSWNSDADIYAMAGNMTCGRGYWVYVFPHNGAEVRLGP